MNPKILTALIGIITIAFGVAGLVYPAQVMDFAELAAETPTTPVAALGEIRAVYGGMLVGLGIATVWAALDPVTRRPTLTLLGILWLCVFGGRMWGVAVDGNPGLVGWLNATMELVAGTLLVAAPYMGGRTAEPIPYTSAASPEQS